MIALFRKIQFFLTLIVLFYIHGLLSKINTGEPDVVKNFNHSLVEFYLPLFDFKKQENTEKTSSSIKSVLYQNKSSSNSALLRDNYIIDSNSTEYLKIEEEKEKQLIIEYIFKETSKPEIILSNLENERDGNSMNIIYNPNRVFGFPNNTVFENRITKSIKNIKIHDFSEISNKIKFSRFDAINIDKNICIPSVQIFSVIAVKDDIIVNSIQTDIYQVSVFVYSKKVSKKINESSWPQTVTLSKSLVLQIVTLADIIGTTYGNMFVNLGDGTTIIIPITLVAHPNQYGIGPIYRPKIAGSKILNVPINIRNPHNDKLIVKEVIHSFNSISLIWPNGQVLSSSNTTNLSPEMMEILPNTEKTIINIYFYKEVSNLEYGLIHFKTDKDTIIVPVLVKVDIKGLAVLPNFFSFGCVEVVGSSSDMISKIKRIIPIRITNEAEVFIKLEAIYIKIEETMIDFYLSDNFKYCTKKESKQNQNEYHFHNCVLPIGTENILLGYLVLDPMNYYYDHGNYSFPVLNNKITGNVIIQTSFPSSPLIFIPYEYYLTNQLFKVAEDYSLNININSLKEDTSIPLNMNSSLETINLINDKHQSLNFTLNSVINKGKDNKQNLFLFSLSINDIKSLKSNSMQFIKFIVHGNLISIIPIRFYNKELKFVFCGIISNLLECLKGDPEIVTGVNLSSQKYSLDLGAIADNEIESRYIFFINDNPEKIMIKNYESYTKGMKIGLESIESLEDKKQVHYKNPQNQQMIKEMAQTEIDNEIRVKVVPDTVACFSISLDKSTNDFSGSAIFKFSSNIVFTINVKAKFIKTTLSMIPNQLRFDSAFPGLFQSKMISAKSSFGGNVIIKNIESDDHRIQVSVLNNVISNTNRTEIIKVNFDPSKVNWEENFMRGNFTMNMAPTKYLTYVELYWWKHKQKIWEQLGAQGKTEIRATIKIQTDIKIDYISVSGSLNKPPLVKKDEIDFKLTQIGEQVNRFIEVVNESDEVMSIQILLAPDEYSDINDFELFSKNKNINLTANKNMLILDCFNLNKNLVPIQGIEAFQNLKSTSDKNEKRKDKDKKSDLKKFVSSKFFVNEEITKNNFQFQSKEKLIMNMFKYSDSLMKTGIVMTDKFICKNEFVNKNEAIFVNDKEMIDLIFSDEFNQEIPIVSKMTEKNLKRKKEVNTSQTGKSIFDILINQFKNIFISEEEIEKDKEKIFKKQEQETFDEDEFDIGGSNFTSHKQNFYLPKAITKEVFYIKPHQKMKIGPIVFLPSDFSNSKATLFIKNNLTILYPIHLKGSGGSGVLEFFTKNEEEKINDRLIIDINSKTLESLKFKENEDFIITKTIKLKNTGTLPVLVGKINVDNVECENYGIKISDCSAITLKPGEATFLDITIKPDFNFYHIEKEIVFITRHNSISLKISISISNEILAEKNRLLNFESFYEENNFYIILLLGFVIILIFHVTFKEHVENKNFEKPSLEFMNFKEELKTNPILIYEYLFIKSFRKQNNEEFSERFFTENFYAKPGVEQSNEPTIKTRKKMKKDNIYSASNKNKFESEEINETQKLKSDTNSNVKEDTVKKEKEREKYNSTLANKKKLDDKDKKEEIKKKPVEIVEKDSASKYQKKKTIVAQSNNNTAPINVQPTINKNLIKDKDDKKVASQPQSQAVNYQQANNSINNKEILSESELLKVINSSKPYIPKNIPNNSQSNLTNLQSNNPSRNNINLQPQQQTIASSNTTSIQEDRSINRDKPNLETNKPSNDFNNQIYNQSLKDIPKEKSNYLEYKFNDFNQVFVSQNPENNFIGDEDYEVDEADRKELLGDLIDDFDDEEAIKVEAIENIKEASSKSIKKISEKEDKETDKDEDKHDEIDDEKDNEQYIKDETLLKDNQNIKNKFAAMSKLQFSNNKSNLKDQRINQEIKSYKSEESEEEKDKSNYLSDLNQIPFESGTEDFLANQFNTNIFAGGNSNSNMKMNRFIDNDENILYKGFGNYSNMAAFSLNPFSNEENEGKGLLGALKDDSEEVNLNDLRDESENNDDEKNVDNNDDDEEEDPEWVHEDMKIERQGYFDVTGDFKLKQTDFNFDLDRKSMMKNKKLK